ncbi:MAG: ornithine carbamoyltransferase [Candidatus Omnitrophica bacterium]|nr:ornithine carbamoyltransferase [Candidatus Omnitrophota bacterium]
MSAKNTKSKTIASKGKKKASSGSKKFVPFATKDLLTMKAIGLKDIEALFALADQIRKSPKKFMHSLEGKTIGLLFQKPSTRTRVSFEVAMAQAGGQAVYLGDKDILMGQREPIKDVARTLSGYFDGVVIRTFDHAVLEEFGQVSTIPVINGLSDSEHPCQILSDLYTIYAKYGKLKDIMVTYIGDSNNVLKSLMYGAAITGMSLSIVTPRGYEPSEEDLKEIKVLAKDSGAKLSLSNNPFASLKNTHVIYTDVWVSMGQERQREQRVRDFQPFQVNQTIVSKALPDALVMHCLPAHRGEEITNEVIEGPHSIVFEQAANRLLVQKALLTLLLNKNN